MQSFNSPLQVDQLAYFELRQPVSHNHFWFRHFMFLFSPCAKLIFYPHFNLILVSWLFLQSIWGQFYQTLSPKCNCAGTRYLVQKMPVSTNGIAHNSTSEQSYRVFHGFWPTYMHWPILARALTFALALTYLQGLSRTRLNSGLKFFQHFCRILESIFNEST